MVSAGCVYACCQSGGDTIVTAAPTRVALSKPGCTASLHVTACTVHDSQPATSSKRTNAAILDKHDSASRERTELGDWARQLQVAQRRDDRHIRAVGKADHARPDNTATQQ